MNVNCYKTVGSGRFTALTALDHSTEQDFFLQYFVAVRTKYAACIKERNQIFIMVSYTVSHF